MSFSTYIPALTTLLGTGAAIDDIQRTADATIRNIESLGDQLAFSTAQRGYQLQELDRVLGDKLSFSALQALQDEATIKAAAAETGASGAFASEAVQSKFMEQNLRDAQTVREVEAQKQSVKMQIVADMLSFDNNVESLQSTMLTPLSAGLKTVNTSLQYFNTGLNLLTPSAKNAALGVV